MPRGIDVRRPEPEMAGWPRPIATVGHLELAHLTVRGERRNGASVGRHRKRDDLLAEMCLPVDLARPGIEGHHVLVARDDGDPAHRHGGLAAGGARRDLLRGIGGGPLDAHDLFAVGNEDEFASRIDRHHRIGDDSQLDDALRARRDVD